MWYVAAYIVTCAYLIALFRMRERLAGKPVDVPRIVVIFTLPVTILLGVINVVWRNLK